MEISFEWKSQRCDIVASNWSRLVHQKVQFSSMQTHSINCQLENCTATPFNATSFSGSDHPDRVHACF